MKGLWKQISLFMAVVLCVGAIFALVPASKVEAAVSGDFEYYMNGDKLIISGYTGTATDVVIPAQLDGKPVAGLGWYAFDNCKKITSVTISEGITMVDEGVFRNCSNLQSVSLPKSITSIGDLMFYGCSSLESIDIHEGILRIGNQAFVGCTSLTTVVIPASLKMIANSVFSNCSNLQSIEVAEGNERHISIDGVLFDEKTMTLCEYPRGREGDYQIPDGTKRIWHCAFEGSKVSGITIPEGVEVVQSGAFRNCDNLTSIFIPASVTTLGATAFEDCEKLTSIEISEDNQKYTFEDGVLFNKDKTTVIRCIFEKEGTYQIPEGVMEIKDMVFKGCDDLKQVIVSSSATEISQYAFDGCGSLDTIEVSADNENYASEGGVFFNKDITKVIKCPEGKTGAYELPNGVTEIGFLAFQNCSKLTSITVHEGVTTIGNAAFLGCNSLRIIYVPEDCYDSYVELFTEFLPESVQIRVIGDIPPLYYGDANADYVVDANDALAILKHVVKLQEITDETALQLADADHNGVIEAADALSTLKVVVKLQEAEVFETDVA